MDDTKILGPVNGLCENLNYLVYKTTLRLNAFIRRHHLLLIRVHRLVGGRCADGQYLPMQTGTILL